VKALFVTTCLTVLLGVAWLPQVGPAIWAAVVVEAVLSVAFAYQLARSR
jgi:hypothetical protein